ncbi:MAG: hypothetical protein K2O40_12490 [Lachnospiraceae bacterium]|nr:hypothetical protein [Lachnospiraceae bacterium]MDE7185257.1 hypothetical protein [Lachnospiraceae bacterium]
MNESYKELLVKREKGAKEALIRAACVALTALAGFLTLMTGKITLFIIVVILGVLDYFIFQWTDIEFEYLYLDKEISVDKIMAKTRRKKLLTIDVNKIEIMAPEKSHQLDSYRNRQTKVTDLSAGHDLPEEKLYWIYYEGSQKFLMNLTEDFANTIKGIAPRKVFTD